MKKHRLRRVAATISSIAMVVMLPMSSMAASAAGDPSVAFVTDKTSVQAGDTIKLSVMMNNMPSDGWNLLEFAIGYDENQLEPVMVWNDIIEEYKEYTAGPAMIKEDTITDVNFGVNPVLGASVSLSKQRFNGEYLSVQFKVKANVAKGEKIILATSLKRLARSVIVDGTSHTIDLLPPSTSSIVLTVR